VPWSKWSCVASQRHKLSTVYKKTEIRMTRRADSAENIWVLATGRACGLQQTSAEAMNPRWAPPTVQGVYTDAHVVVVADDDEVDGWQVRVLHRQGRRDDALRPDALQPAVCR